MNLILPGRKNRFLPLLVTLLILLVGYPHWGSLVGALISLIVILPALYAVRAAKGLFVGAVVLSALATVSTVGAMVFALRGHAIVEIVFLVFYGYIVAVIYWEIMRTRVPASDTLYGAVSVYLLLGIAFAQLYDVIETMAPGSFSANEATFGTGSLGWRHLLFYSFMTLTTVGYGDVTPATDTTRSLAILESTAGVLYVAIMIARLATASFVRREDVEEDED